ncbi:YafY family protein [Methylobacter sp. Wu8]|jgi:predicted DNA-binding transcriptional regulator YafY|uniref:WYL domain-containing protein n=1 Tax=Methylobacter tundripaludum TaxID=173365 RepID=A0A2S6GZU9_9GAMM|nr:YafY family protein [Methylobacter tundripaludum]MCF7966275.1 YafY family transcriptional regulator [Methylobacter tundripaludum]MCK9634777.1 YafY family transcriptional regulator [Methylobacter tundripaludum]PPK70680.1 WYL domain-containing protein [Methylobacter tundripaludum]
MRRADRLFQIVQILRNKRLVTAKTLAERLEVSERTIYRDIQDLSLSGVPVEGEAGVGYMLRHSIDIPPIMFTSDEIEALVVGARMVKTWAGTELGYSAQSALDKITAVIPAELRTKIEDSKLFSLRFSQRQDLDVNLDICRKAIDDKRLLQMGYCRADGEQSLRRIRPLGLYFWGNVWTLVGWCELRDDFRNFRLDRIQSIQSENATFIDIEGQSLQDFIKRMTCM